MQVQVQEPHLARCHHYNLQVYNGECLNTPDAVVVAGSNQDVSTIVKAVTQSSTHTSKNQQIKHTIEIHTPTSNMLKAEGLVVSLWGSVVWI